MQLHPALTPEQEAAALQGTAALYATLDAELHEQLAKFEAHVLGGCLKVPPGLLAHAAAAAAAVASGTEGPVDDAEEAAVRAEYEQLRGEMQAAREAARAKQRQIKVLEVALERSRAEAGQLSAVVATVAGKENALAEDAAAIAKVAMATERQVVEAGMLQARQQQQQQQCANSRANDPAAERDILRRQTEIQSKPCDALGRIAERLAG